MNDIQDLLREINDLTKRQVQLTILAERQQEVGCALILTDGTNSERVILGRERGNQLLEEELAAVKAELFRLECIRDQLNAALLEIKP